ncbi:FtsX-like permease family protein [Streptomyces sp. ML-6]|uniref:FtsX-like permease family protein n=1 Tax=Streptomyces sp. ML-6 TaxID=2982693 RepID=UPI0024C0571A|nr:FtsX-like permease family protein [Streptomyces sp. ML-6]MDK0521856.1 ABC transporter permease [Streptomyces sp. ML-6]
MTLLDEKSAAAPPAAPRPTAPTGLAAWIRDLGLGMRFGAGGGREGWIRTALTAVGVGLGVALLLTAASVPHMLQQRSDRSAARAANPLDPSSGGPASKSGASVLLADIETEFRGHVVEGWLMRADGAHPVRPPGVDRFPAPGEMVVSPALKELLGSSDGALLRERLPYRTVGTIGTPGLVSPNDLVYYAGDDTLATGPGTHRIAGYGDRNLAEEMPPILIVLIIMICVVLLMPVAIFIVTAVRFGGDRRDRRLAALRLVGTDIRMTRRIAAGEALFGALLGVVTGVAFFLVGRQFVGRIEMWNVSVFPADLVPDLRLTALVVVAVPLTAVVVTLGAMRAVVVEPLGVIRNGRSRGRRLWWRLPLPFAGLAVLGLTGKVDTYGTVDPYPIAGGAVLVLVGLALLLPWLVEALVNRLHGGPVAWQLAIRRLQLSSGSASRAVSGITVAVAGAVALQMLTAAVADEFIKVTEQDSTRAQFSSYSEKVTRDGATRTVEALRAAKGVTWAIGKINVYVTHPGDAKGAAGGEGEVQRTTSLTVADCASLREMARIGSCKDGDTFVSHPAKNKELSLWVDKTARKGEDVVATSGDLKKSVRWRLPADARTVTARNTPLGDETSGILATLGAVDPSTLPDATTETHVRVDESVEDVAEYVRNAVAEVDRAARVSSLTSVARDKKYASVQRGLQVGGTATLLLIAASMMVSQLEQLRERKRLLSVLVAFGTRRSTLGWSVLWQTAVPVVVGLAVAVAGGIGLGATLISMLDKEVTDWWLFLPMAGAGGALILLVTLISLPPLWRMMRPEGLRTE